MFDNKAFIITRKIEIDAGHRIMDHGSKCRHIHGHRYVIESICSADKLHDQGEQKGMVLDFSFIKQEMTEVITNHCDHSLILYNQDIEALNLFCPTHLDTEQWHKQISSALQQKSFYINEDNILNTKLYIMNQTPTAECLAHHWYKLLQQKIIKRSKNLCKLYAIKVWETPNCSAQYTINT